MANISDQGRRILPENSDPPSVDLPDLAEEEKQHGNGTDGEFGIPVDRKILYQSVAIVLSALVVYVTFALLQYNWLKSGCHQQHENRGSSMKRRPGGKDSGGTSDSSNSTAHNSCRSKTLAARNSRILRIMCVVASVLTFFRIASEQLEILPARKARVECRDYQIAMVVTYCLAITMLYGILWYRVRVFLSHPAMRHLGSKVLTALAFAVLGVIIVASVVNAAMFLVTTVSHDAHGGCIVESPGNILSNSARFAILTVSTVVSQASLLGLFLYPLVRHSASMQAAKISAPTPKRGDNDSKKAGRTQSMKSTLSPGTLTRSWKKRNSSRRQKREQALLKIIRRVMITAIICAVSDIFCGLIVRLVTEEPRVVTNLIFDVNLVVNLACVLMSFKDWRVRMFPCCVHARKHKHTDAESLKRPASSKDKKLNLAGNQAPSSPAVFTSRESSATQGLYATSESGMISPSPKEESQEFDRVESADITASEDTGKSV